MGSSEGIKFKASRAEDFFPSKAVPPDPPSPAWHLQLLRYLHTMLRVQEGGLQRLLLLSVACCMLCLATANKECEKLG